MYSPKLMHILLCLLVVAVVYSVAVKYLFKDDAKWQQVSLASLAAQMEHGIQQMYWQWQQEGRPSSIVYQPEHAEQAMVIQMNKTGIPVVGNDDKACEIVLSWFVQKAAVNTFVQAKKVIGNERDGKGNGCEFTLAERTIFYQSDNATILY
ncbi:hypothetical protein KJ365_12420 [Glaciecola sp. XM2]|jgi:hypothetical protein|uniref:hypothetical protein n=1 Tax=Glaciecola sp. XM2 TaxID=1914931 RepID=UPI001BDE4874|nr:hypothetical protein [Glaciecola sp. XM2]MBT1451688.1 hypothetical protein [Glaciecola sp. XM2]